MNYKELGINQYHINISYSFISVEGAIFIFIYNLSFNLIIIQIKNK